MFRAQNCPITCAINTRSREAKSRAVFSPSTGVVGMQVWHAATSDTSWLRFFPSSLTSKNTAGRGKPCWIDTGFLRILVALSCSVLLLSYFVVLCLWSRCIYCQVRVFLYCVKIQGGKKKKVIGSCSIFTWIQQHEEDFRASPCNVMYRSSVKSTYLFSPLVCFLSRFYTLLHNPLHMALPAAQFLPLASLHGPSFPLRLSLWPKQYFETRTGYCVNPSAIMRTRRPGPKRHVKVQNLKPVPDSLFMRST